MPQHFSLPPASAKPEAKNKPRHNLLELPAEVLQTQLLPCLRASGRGNQAAFASTCTAAHAHVMEAVSKPLMGQLRRHFAECQSGRAAIEPTPLQESHPAAGAWVALQRLGCLFEMPGLPAERAATAGPPQMSAAVAIAVVDEALQEVLGGRSQTLLAQSTALASALNLLKGALRAPLDAWMREEEAGHASGAPGCHHARMVILEQALQFSRHLYLRSDWVPKILPPVWLLFDNLRTLHCGDLHLTRLPDELGFLHALNELDVGGSQLVSLPEGLVHLRQLRRLVLRYNQFRAVPAVLGRMPQLWSLDLFGNPLVDAVLPSGLIALRKLDMGGCGLVQLPESLFALTTLIEVMLSFNRLEVVPNEIARLSALTYFAVGGNRLTRLPEALTQLRGLKSLFVDSNPLIELPLFVGHMLSLRQLCVSSGEDATTPPSHALMLPAAIGDLRYAGKGWYMR